MICSSFGKVKMIVYQLRLLRNVRHATKKPTHLLPAEIDLRPYYDLIALPGKKILSFDDPERHSKSLQLKHKHAEISALTSGTHTHEWHARAQGEVQLSLHLMGTASTNWLVYVGLHVASLNEKSILKLEKAGAGKQLVAWHRK